MKSILNLPPNFETYPEARKKGFLRMKALKDSGKQVVGLFCSFVPLELVYAAGLVPVGLCSRHGLTGDVMLTGGLCESGYLIDCLSKKLGTQVCTDPMGRYAGALGAALIARGKRK